MKTIMISLMVLIGSLAFADVKPLLTKSSGGGFTHPDYVRYEGCELYADRVVITKRYGSESGFELKEERKITLSGDIDVTIKKAFNEKIEEKENGLCDGPVTSIRMGEQLLYTTGGCGSPRKDRVGPFSLALKDVISTYCPNTYDFSR